MKRGTEAKVKYGGLGLIVGAVIAMIIGFSWGGWTTASAAKKMTEKAVLASQAKICVAQFVKDPNYKTNIEAFEKLDSYGQKNTGDYVQKFGWDKMPGEKMASPGVAEICATGIEAIIKN